MSDQEREVLIVEDDESMSIALRDGFGFEGYAVRLVGDGPSALEAFAEKRPDLIILDVMLPKLSGLEVCQRLRGEGHDVPIIMLTARGQEIDKVLGLKLGADDYVTKPFSFMELAARAEALLRRAGGSVGTVAESPKRYSFGDVEVDFESHRATKGGAELELTARELRLLEHFVRHRGAVITRDQLLDEVWGYDSMPFTRTVDSHVAKLRKKIEQQPSSPRFLLTVHGLGYKFVG